MNPLAFAGGRMVVRRASIPERLLVAVWALLGITATAAEAQPKTFSDPASACASANGQFLGSRKWRLPDWRIDGLNEAQFQAARAHLSGDAAMNRRRGPTSCRPPAGCR